MGLCSTVQQIPLNFFRNMADVLFCLSKETLHDSPSSLQPKDKYSSSRSFLSRSQPPTPPDCTSSCISEETENTLGDTQSRGSGSSASDHLGGNSNTSSQKPMRCLGLDASYNSMERCQELLASSAAIRRDLESVVFTTNS